MTAAMLASVTSYLGDERIARDRALARAGLPALCARPEGSLALLNGTQFSPAEALSALFAARARVSSPPLSQARSPPTGEGSDTPFDPRIHVLRGHRGQIEVAARALRELMTGAASALRI